jgi:hypothetical protein
MIEKITKFLVLFTMSAILFSGCYYDKEDLLYPVGACDASAVTYATDIEPLLSNSCYGCHSNTQSQTAGAGISLEGHANLSSYVNTQADRLIGAVRQEPSYSPMPKGGSPLDACSIQKLQAWIDAGAPNN